MAVTIKKRPSRTILTNPSRWTAASNPILYLFSRRDFTVTEIKVFDGDKVRARIIWDGSEDLIDIQVGDTIFLGDPAYNVTAVVTDAVLGAGVRDIYLDTPFTKEVVSSPLSFMNLVSRRFNYKIETSIYEADTNKLLGVRRIAPFRDGLVKLDLSVIVSTYLNNSDNFGYSLSTINETDTGKAIKFYIKYRETWNGSDESETSDIANPIFAVNAVRQLGDENGQNLHDYTPDALDVEFKAKFLTDFNQPVMWQGYPFSLSFIFSEKIPYTLQKQERQLDINKAPLNSFSFAALDTVYGQTVNRLKLKESSFLGTAKFLEVGLKTGSFVESEYVYVGYVENGYVEK